MDHNLTSISPTECLVTANSRWGCLVLLLPWGEAVRMSGRERQLVHKDGIYQQRWCLMLQEMGESKDFCRILGGKGIAAKSLLAGLQRATELNHRDPSLPLWRLDWLARSWVTLATSAAACVEARDTPAEKLEAVSCWSWTVFLSSVSLSRLLTCPLHATVTF